MIFKYQIYTSERLVPRDLVCDRICKQAPYTPLALYSHVRQSERLALRVISEGDEYSLDEPSHVRSELLQSQGASRCTWGRAVLWKCH